jgi:tRNA-splicing ligase RtcB
MYRDVDGVLVWGDPEETAIEQMKTCLDVGQDEQDIAMRGALMADAHLGYSMPIGGVVAYRGWVSPSGVGYDIACGNKAVRTTLTWGELRPDLEPIMDAIAHRIEFGMGRSNSDPAVAEHKLFDKDSHPSWDFEPIKKLKRKAQNQLGTVGSGNHYVDLFVESDTEGAAVEWTDDSRVWVGVHFGSRGLGHSIATGFLKLAKHQRWEDKARGEQMMDAPVMIRASSLLGQEYLSAMDLAGRYAYAGRDYVVEQVLDILGVLSDFEVHNHHNFAWPEEHEGEHVWVVRKGATPAYPGQLGFIGGSMADIAVIVKGVNSIEAQASMYSTVHGAGRTMSRTKAAGKLRKQVDGTRRRVGGLITPEQMYDRVDAYGVVLRGGGADESPFVYRDLSTVLQEHAHSLEVLHWLKPVGVAMAGEDVRDDYKD